MVPCHSLQGEREGEKAAAALPVAKADGAPHEFNQPFADGQPQSAAAILTLERVVHLAEALEEQGLLVFRDADAGVGHGELESISSRTDGQLDSSLVGKLQGIAKEIDQHLLESTLIGDDDGGQFGCNGLS